MATLADSFSGSPSSTAIIIPEPRSAPLTFTYSQLSQHVSTFQARLAALGLSPQAAVSIALPNSYAFVVAFLATSWQRAIAAPLNPAYKQEEFEFYIDDLKSAIALVPRGSVAKDGAAVRAARKFNAAIAECYWDDSVGEVILDVKESGKLSSQPIARAQPDDVALVLHTSGTTGRPKAVPLTHRNLTTTMRNVTQTYRLTPQDRTLLVMPLFHVHGLLAAFLAPLHSGGSIIIPPSFSASTFWKHFTTHAATWYTAVPTIHQILLKTALPSPLPPIRFIRSCSSPLSPSVFHALEKTFQAPVLEAYAMTEAAHQMTSNPLPPAKRIPGSVGVGQGVEVRIVDADGRALPQGQEGEICIRGANVTAGYLNNPAANASSFTPGERFFRTGDQGKLDQDGYVFITGRIKELINKGGEKISPIELDNVIAQHPRVAEAVSFAMDDEMYGQEVGVAVVAREEGEPLSEEDLKAWNGSRCRSECGSRATCRRRRRARSRGGSWRRRC
jgi:acyl-CoA synthetase (AMP-forming)/AMP-acid ligase II